MNDPIKYMLAGATIAIFSGMIGLGVGVWAVRSSPTTESRVARAAVPAKFAPSQPVAAPRVLPTTSSAVLRQAHGNDDMQKALDSAAVKQAREAYLSAQKQYTEALQSAMGKQPTFFRLHNG
jgi:hypothetical protein